MLRAARLIAHFVEGLKQSAFEADLKTQSAVLHQVMVLGEAVTRLSDSFRDANADIPWRLIVGMRHRLIHGYDDVDLDEVWQTVTRDLPDFRALPTTKEERACR